MVCKVPVSNLIDKWFLYANTFKVSCMWNYIINRQSFLLTTWPSGKLPFECQKIAKNLTFFSKKLTTKLPLAILLKKMTIFVNFFFKCQVFGNFLTVKWQFSGGSGRNRSIFTLNIMCVSSSLHWLFRKTKHKTFISFFSPKLLFKLKDNSYRKKKKGQ